MAIMKHVVSIPWSDEERALLRQLRENGLGPVQISKLMGRSKYSIDRQMQRMGLPPRPAPDMTPRNRPPTPQPLRRGARTLPPLPSEL